ncbi:MAG: carbamate kinase [Thermodesulfobacteriota bacterium]
MRESGKKVIVSLGGNAIIRRGETGTVEEQFENTGKACEYMARMAAEGRSVIITHGNGPIVGNILIRNEAMKEKLPPMPLYICDADSEGGIGFMIQQTLHNRLRKAHMLEDVVTVVTQVVVDRNDPAFSDPTKPIGPYYTIEEAEELTRNAGGVGWSMVEDAGRNGAYRRVVPSPRPMRVVEAAVIKKLAETGTIVIAAGGGGVPVTEDPDGTLTGVDAVIDKDLATSTLAREVGAELFINLTEIDMVYLGFGTPEQKGIEEMTVKEAKGYLAEGQFPAGSMGPKIEAAIEFLENGGKEVFITTPELIEEALEGRAGTKVTP